MRSGDETTVSVLRFPEGSATARLGVRDFEIHWISRGFRISDWIPVFHVDFWISGFHSGFLDFRLDFCLQCTRFLSWRTPRGFRTSAFSTCPMYFPVRLAGRGKRHTRSTLATDVVLEGEMHLRRHGTLFFFCEIRAERPTITRCKLFILKLHF